MAYPDSTVTVIDGASDSVITTVRTGLYPYALCYNPLGNKVYAASWGDTAVRVIDGATDSVIAKLRVGRWPSALCYNPRSDKVYCANAGPTQHRDSTVTVIDGATDSVIVTLRVGRSPQSLCYNSTDNKVYCGNYEDSLLAVIDGEGDSVIATVRCERPVAFCYDSVYNRVYCTNDWNGTGSTVTVIDGMTDSVIVVIRVGSGPRGLCSSPAHGRIYVANTASSSISVIRTSPPGVEESFGLTLPVVAPAATVVRGVINLQPPVAGRQSLAVLLDVAGRKVLALSPGENDVRALAPGVYFVREGGPKTVRKIVLVR
jgi:YVTN family beta-propeller protein